jgi:hypothetical protein
MLLRTASSQPDPSLRTLRGIVLGLLMAVVILLVVHDPRRAIRGDATDAG